MVRPANLPCMTAKSGCLHFMLYGGFDMQQSQANGSPPRSIRENLSPLVSVHVANVSCVRTSP